MEKNIYLIMEQDLAEYPPTLSLINALLDLRFNVNYIGYYSDLIQKTNLSNKGVCFHDVIKYAKGESLFKKLLSILKFKKQVVSILKQESVSDEYVWILGHDTICALSSIVGKYNTVLMFYEFTHSYLNIKYKLLFPHYNLEKTLKSAKKIVHCEYNRAQITMGLNELSSAPFVLPNKPYFSNDWRDNIPEDIVIMVDNIKEMIRGKKVLLYQGLFNSSERRLEEFCLATNKLPEEVVFMAMGHGSNYYDDLKRRYESDRILFLPFVRPPYHLLITEMCSIGVMSYFPRSKDFVDVINPLYCAPNKIFEYSLFGIPMLANDIPGLHSIFSEYKCGVCVPMPLTVENIVSSVKRILDNYSEMSKGSLAYYDSVDVKSIISQIVS